MCEAALPSRGRAILGPGRSGATETHTRLARPPRPGPTRARPAGPPCSAITGSWPGRSVFISARAPRSRSGALFAITQYHVWGMRPGRKTKPQAEAAAAGGDRAGGGERGGEKQSPARGWAGAHPAGPHGPSYSWGARKPGAGGEHVTPVRSGGEPRVSVEFGEPQPRLVLLEELWGDHLEPFAPDPITKFGFTHRPGHTGSC